MKPIKNYENRYAVTEDGQVYSYRTKRFLKPWYNERGYAKVTLCMNSTPKHYFIHRLVAEAYLPEPLAGQTQINHKDENKQNNNVDNLEWVTPKENINYGTANARRAMSLGKPVYVAELDEVYPSMAAAASELDLSYNALRNALRKGVPYRNMTFSFCEVVAR